MFELRRDGAKYSLMAAASALAQSGRRKRDSPFSYWFRWKTAAEACVLWLSLGLFARRTRSHSRLPHNGHFFFPFFFLHHHRCPWLLQCNTIICNWMQVSVSVSLSVQAFGSCVWPVDDELRLVLLLFLSVIHFSVLVCKWIIKGTDRWTVLGQCPLSTLSSLPTSQLTRTNVHEWKRKQGFIAYNFISRRTEVSIWAVSSKCGSNGH